MHSTTPLVPSMDTYLLAWGLLLIRLGNLQIGGFATTAPSIDEDFESLCSLRCPFQNKTEDNFDAGCGLECKLMQCSRGCNLWRKALETSCQAVCNGTQSMLAPRELHCVLGCNGAVDQYFQKLRDEIGTPPAPYLVADTLTATSLSLAWEGKRYLDISYLVQWRYEEHAGAWQYCRNQTWGPTSVVLVDNLQPFTKYRFRVALLLSPHSEPIVSRPSVVISTLAAGPPTSAPIIVRATAVDSRRITISWKPGPFPNGPIHSYILQLVGEFISFKEDIPVTRNVDFYMFQNLNANSKYLVSVSMRNAEGEGPAAMAEISTPAEPLVKDAPQPILILGSRQRVIKQRADMLNSPQIVYQSSYDITGIAIHVKKNLLFVSDASGHVTVASLAVLEEPKKILTPDDTSFRPLDLSVDWLNQHLYILGEVMHEEGPMWQVSRCGLDGRGLTVAVAGITVRPLHVEVDPFNGYLFWLIQGQAKGGLYRLDLANISNGIKHEVTPDIIMEDPNLGAFVVDHTNFCVLVPNHVKNTVYSVSLDGRDVIDVRANTQQALFRNVTSLAITNGLFYWTNGDEVFAEDYHEGQNTYFHNHYPGLTDRSYVSVAVDLPATQPTPVPINPPIQVQAVLGGNLAKVTWQMPHLVGGQGKGAWQSWIYALQVKELSSETVITQTDIVNTTYCTIDGLSGDSDYVIKVAAYTSSGYGPWSSEFRGKTLRTPINGEYPMILWSAAEGLLQSDVTGEEVEALISAENMKDGKGQYHIVDTAWMNDGIYLVSNHSKLFKYNISNHQLQHIPDFDFVGSIDIDWIGKKLYWSNPKQQLIMRGNIVGTQQEPLPILTIAKELSVDSEHAFIYWSTGHAVESARLNGESRRVYYPAQLFSGKQVMGLTLNLDDRHLYWIVRSSEGSTLHKAPMMGARTIDLNIEPIVIANLQHPNMQGPLCYFSDHLLWLQDNRNAVIGDLDGQNAAVISGIGLSGLNMVAIRDTNTHTGFQDVNVIPDQVSNASIRVQGTWSNFNITWAPVTNVNFGQVFYEVTVVKEFAQEQQVTAQSVLQYAGASEIPPYTRLEVTVKAFTYWGGSGQVQKVLYSPPSRPTAPTNVRVFVHHEQESTTAVLRWNVPLHPNGLLTGYQLKCWIFVAQSDESTDICGNVQIKPEKQDFAIRNLQFNSTYYFQIQALTTAGEGDLSPIVVANTSQVSPIPLLILATNESVKIVDCDSQVFHTLSSAIRPVAVTWSSAEKAIFWLNDQKEIYRIQYDGSNKTKIHSLKGFGVSLTIDWIGRYLYWSELEDREMASSIHRLDLSQIGTESISSERIIRRNRRIHELEISPLTGTLYWVEVNRHGAGHLLRSRTDGTSVHTLFSVHIGSTWNKCSCPENPRVGRTFSLDQTQPYNPRVLYSDDTLGFIYQTGPTGCQCSVVLQTKGKAIPSSLTSDHQHIFWANETEGKIYMTDKKNFVEISHPGVSRIRAIGAHLQPRPAQHCLTVESIINKPDVLKVTSRSIVLQLPHADRPSECENISTASSHYSIYYGIISNDGYPECGEDLHNCMKVITYHRTIEITQLKPFSSYIVRVSIQNYYTNLKEIPPVLAPTIVAKTSAGAPSPPRNVNATCLTPTLIEVEWLPPIEFNDQGVAYEVHWKTEGIVSGMRQSGELVVGIMDDWGTQQNVTRKIQVRKLMPGQLYQVWVRAYSQNSEYFMDSDPIEVDTYPFPNNITLAQATPYSLEVFWSPPRETAKSCLIQYYDFNFGAWQNVTRSIEDLSFTRYFVEELTPKTLYLFRMNILYENSLTPYIWPMDGRYSFETLGDRPSRPGTPVIQHLRRGVYQVVWEPSRENGAHIELYVLEGKVGGNWKRKREANYTTLAETGNIADVEQWVPYYNGTDTYWIISDLSPSLKYVFRVRARNRYGWSDSSEISKSFDYTEAAMLADQQELGIVLGITLPIAVLLCVVGLILFCCVFKKREKEKKELQILTLAQSNRGPDVELATLRELPRRGNFITNANLLYAAAEPPTDEEIAMLPHIRREQFKLTKFLGSGAFGEVYEGIAQGIPGTEGSAMVAIKALRKGASEQEKSEFLKEAQLMSHFKHQHILQLVGVCLDNDPNYILMELMEGGDLLSYLRTNRPLINTHNAMKLLDLLEICVDVAKGCRYLEDMHFVHRDLACRNCLVSSLDTRNRVVKIGDFGLARDIYKNDYYRKEGEGLLPVRWMAPESLVDGVFTSQSDVWSFGVLLWEIMTLGQQPYPARTNIEVLHYVRTGGRLGRPCNCSEELHQLMMKCWNFNPESRPTFRYCLETLTTLKERTANGPLTPPLSGMYLEIRTGKTSGNENEGYYFEDDIEGSGSTWKDDGDTSREDVSNTPTKTSPHSYLQLLYEDSPPVAPTDGYEVPRTRTFSGASCVSETEPSAPFIQLVPSSEPPSTPITETKIIIPNSFSTETNGPNNNETACLQPIPPSLPPDLSTIERILASPPPTIADSS